MFLFHSFLDFFYFLLYNIAKYYHVKCESVCVSVFLFVFLVFVLIFCLFVYKTWLSSPPYTNKCVFVSVWECLFSSLSMLVYTFFVLFTSHTGSINTVFCFVFTNNTHSHFFSLTLMLRSFYCLLFTHTHTLSLGRDKICFTFYSVVV